MSSTDGGGAKRPSDLEALLREHGVDDTLAHKIRALIAKGPAEQERSSPRPIVLHPPTREAGMALRRETVSQVASLVTQPARPHARDASAEATPISLTPATTPSSLGELGGIPVDGPMLVPISLLGEGGMGEVHRMRDVLLGRDIAMKVLHGQLATSDRMRGRFLDEAQITAQLSHPSIPPVHALGLLEDGRPYFTMKRVYGRTLAEILDDDKPLAEQRRIEIFQRVCEAVAYAHARGVIHCDLKPLNVMVGAFGEVLVMDWGVAHLVPPARTTHVEEPPVQTTSASSGAREVAGTPAYMPPEQALGDLGRLGPPSDVYALGVMLFELLAGSRPYHGGVPQLLFLAAQGNVPAIPRREGSAVDEAIEAIIHKAMRPHPADRYPDAGVLAEEVGRWREGAMRREKAIGIVKQATEKLVAIAPVHESAERLRREAAAELALLPPEADPELRRGAWAKEDAAQAADQEASLATARVEQMLEAALVHAPELTIPKALLADLAMRRHRKAEAARAFDEAALHEVRLRAYDVGEHAGYLSGHSRLTLATKVPAVASLSRFVLENRRLVARRVGIIGPTPLLQVELPIGSYRLDLEAEGRPWMGVMVVIRRGEDCVIARPGSSEPTLLDLPEVGALSEDEVLVSAGWFDSGALADERVWVDAFVAKRDPVTFRELLPFLASERGAPFRASALRDGLGMFQPDWPAVGVSWECAQAYAAWCSERDGDPWRLPYEVEWEKAARGADGRAFPWGDAREPSFAHVRDGGRTPTRPEAVDGSIYDVSPYGVRGMAGNVREWCADAFFPIETKEAVRTPAASSRRVARGGSYRLPLEAAQTTARSGLPADRGFVDVGFRLVRSL